MSMFGGTAFATISWALQPPGTQIFVSVLQMVPGSQSPSAAHMPGSMQVPPALQIWGGVHEGVHPKVPPPEPPEPPPPEAVEPPLGCCCEELPVSDAPQAPVNTAASPRIPNADAHRQTARIFIRAEYQG
jgi:hypothetical protein